MIDPQWTVIDLDPRTWRNLGQFFDVSQYLRTAQPGEKALFVLHDQGRPVNVYDSQRGHRADLVAGPIDDPLRLAHDLYESQEWERVHVIDRQHLRAVARQAQTLENRALTLDQYYHRVYELMWSNPRGYVSLPPHPGHWQAWTYRQIQDFVAQITGPAALVLGVLDGATVNIGLILVAQGGLIRHVTTFEALQAETPPALSADGFEQLWQTVAQQVAAPVAALLCTQAAFDRWIAAGDKAAALSAAVAQGEAFWRLA